MNQRKKTVDKQRQPIGRRSSGTGRHTFVVAVAAAMVFAALGLFHTWTRVAVLDRTYQYSRARGENQKLAREASKLKLEVAMLAGLGRVDQQARAKLQMTKADTKQVVVIEATSAALARND